MKSIYYLGIFSGILIGTSYIPLPPWALLFCYAPLWIAWQKSSTRTQIFLVSWICQFIFSLIGNHWIAYTAHEFGRIPWVVSSLILVFYAAVNNFFLPLAGLLVWEIKSRTNYRGMGLVALMALTTLVTESFFYGLFPWTLSYSLLPQPLGLLQWSDAIGFQGLTIVLFAVNASVVIALMQRKWSPLFITLSFLALLEVTGQSRKELFETPTGHSMTALLVQPNVGNSDKLIATSGSRFQIAALDNLHNITEQGLLQSPSKVDLIIWPETAVPADLSSLATDYEKPGYISQMVKSKVDSWATSLLTGGFTRQDGKVYNSLYLLHANAKELGAQPYHKSILLAFGEYLPFEYLYPWLRKLVPSISSFGVGPGPTVFDTPFGRLGMQICYESLYPEYSLEMANKGANILVNVTNDSWFGDWYEPYQHLQMNRARVFETRLPLLRATNTGITTVIDRSGNIRASSAMGTAQAAYYSVDFESSPEKTIFVKFGYLLRYLAAAALLLAFVGGAIRWHKST